MTKKLQVLFHSLFLILFPTLAFFAALTSSPVLNILFVIAGASLALFNLSSFLYAYRSPYVITSFVVLIMFAFINSFSYDNPRYIYYVCFLPLAYAVSACIRNRQRLTQFSMFICIAIVLSLLLGTLLFNGFSGYSYEHIIEGKSSNGFTSLLIIYYACYLALSNDFSSKNNLLLTFLVLIACVGGYGRSSIVAALDILIAQLVDCFFFNHIHKILPLIILVSVVSGIFFEVNNSLYASFNPLELTKFSSSQSGEGISSIFYDFHRLLILNDYASNLDLSSFIFGNDNPRLLFNFYYNGNPHNSLLNSHRLFGIFYFIALYQCLRHFPCRLARWPHLILLLIVLYRSLSEPILFPSQSEFIVFLILWESPCRDNQMLNSGQI